MTINTSSSRLLGRMLALLTLIILVISAESATVLADIGFLRQGLTLTLRFGQNREVLEALQPIFPQTLPSFLLRAFPDRFEFLNSRASILLIEANEFTIRLFHYRLFHSA